MLGGAGRWGRSGVDALADVPRAPHHEREVGVADDHMVGVDLDDHDPLLGAVVVSENPRLGEVGQAGLLEGCSAANRSIGSPIGCPTRFIGTMCVSSWTTR